MEKEIIEEINYIEKYEEIENKFNKYIKDNYSLKTLRIKYKFEHTHRVVENAEHIARDLGLDEENVFVAKIIALFHDLGRFEQITKYDSFEDHNTIDHGKYATDILFKDNLMREFLEDSQYDSIFKEAILNHNKYEIETKRLTEQQLLHAKIIRDADKTDALYIKANKDVLKAEGSNMEELENSLLSNEVYEEFMDETTVLNTNIKTLADKWMSSIAFVFGYNFVSGLKIIADEGYMTTIKNKVEFKNEDTINKVQNMYTLVENYINYRISNNINF